ncbi:MAG: hypothetical protein LBH38_02645, partial [Holosporales bacterium]|nr:hypothetical protein [Holosporales bacterium]
MLPLRFFTISGVFLFLSVGHAHALYPYHSEEYKESATQPISETSILTRAITDPIDPPAQEASQPTTSVTLRGVLPSAFEAGDYNLPPLTLPIEVYDAQNVLHTLNVEITSAGLFAFCVTVHGSDGESVLNETGNAFQTYVDGSGQFLTGMFGSSVGSSLDMHITWNNGEDSIIALQYGEDFSKNNSMIPPTYEHVFGTTERVDPPAQEASQPTTSVTLRGVLPSAFEAGDYNLSPLNMPIEVYDAQNVLHTLNVEINAEAFVFCVTVHG